MLAFRLIVTVLGGLAAYLGLNLVLGGSVGAIVAGVFFLLVGLGLLVLGLYTLRGSAEDVTSRLTARQRELQSRVGREPGASAPSTPEVVEPTATHPNRAARRAAARRRP